jgi:coenzyme F420-dependent glucose-6-phosphate dehydrogenase
LGLGSGQALNEQIAGGRWPPKPERNGRLREGADIIRALWAGETVTRQGLIPVEEATLYTRAEQPPRLMGAALTPATAEWLGSWADGLITINKPREQIEPLIEAFRRGGGVGKPLVLQVHLSYARTDEEARQLAYEQWRANIIASPVAEILRTPEQFDAATRTIRPEDLEGHVLMSCDPQRHIDWIGEYADMGFEEIYLHNTGVNQREFIEVFGERVLPQVS